jgi:hypothetical protein
MFDFVVDYEVEVFSAIDIRHIEKDAQTEAFKLFFYLVRDRLVGSIWTAGIRDKNVSQDVALFFPSVMLARSVRDRDETAAAGALCSRSFACWPNDLCSRASMWPAEASTRKAQVRSVMPLVFLNRSSGYGYERCCRASVTCSLQGRFLAARNPNGATFLQASTLSG